MRTPHTVETSLRHLPLRDANGVWAKAHWRLVVRSVSTLALITSGLLVNSAQAQPFAYVTNSNSSSVSIIDTATISR